jgi:hypothetical protein
MAQGMNWGILTLLVTIAGVLAAFVAFFVCLARKAATAAAETANPSSGRASVLVNPEFRRFSEQLGLSQPLTLPDRIGPVLDSTRPRL